MTLGPGMLTHYRIKHILKQKKYKKALRRFSKSKIEWSDKTLSALKQEIRLALRDLQQGRCIFCRRITKLERRNAQEDIEHYLDKSKQKYRRWAFSCFNLAIACHACNLEKSTRDLGKMHTINQFSAYPKGTGSFSWLHPYFDDYHANIDIRKGWIYQVKEKPPSQLAAEKFIEECKLGQIQKIEAYAEKIKEYILRLTMLSHKALQRGHKERAEKLIMASIAYQNEQNYNY